MFFEMSKKYVKLHGNVLKVFKMLKIEKINELEDWGHLCPYGAKRVNYSSVRMVISSWTNSVIYGIDVFCHIALFYSL